MNEKTRFEITAVICVLLGAGLAWGYAGLSIWSLLVGGLCGLGFSVVCVQLEDLLDRLMFSLLDDGWEEEEEE
jgi:F0F1-type ATP synthase membrane subunit c/vacuolar-type H+-ATPase subunit K